MNRFFSLDNPVWKFVGNLADMFLLSILWYLCCIPIITIGCASTAVYYVMLKMVTDREGYTISSFFKAFHSNFKTSTPIWLIFLACGIVLGIDFTWCFLGTGLFAKSMFIPFSIISMIYCLCLSFIFPLMARYSDTGKKLLGLCFVISIRNFLPVLSTVLITVGTFSLGLFIFWPILLIAPGFTAYLNSYVFHHILCKYNMDLPE